MQPEGRKPAEGSRGLSRPLLPTMKAVLQSQGPEKGCRDLEVLKGCQAAGAFGGGRGPEGGASFKEEKGFRAVEKPGSKPRAPKQMDSGALGSLGFRV